MTPIIDSSSWSRVALGKVVVNVNDYFDRALDGVMPFVAGPHIAEFDPTVTSYGSTADDKFPPTFKRKFQQGDVLLHSRSINKLAVADRAGVTGEKLFVLRTRDDTVLRQEVLVWLLQSSRVQEHLENYFTGSVNKFLNWNPLSECELELPSVGDQKRVADILWAVERHRLELVRLKTSVGIAMDVELAEMWEAPSGKRLIGDIATCSTGFTPSKGNDAYWNSDDVPFYTPSEIISDTILRARQRVSEAGAAKGHLLPRFSVAVACIGGDMGKSAVILEPGISNQQITSIVGLGEGDAYALQSLLAHSRGRQAMEARETTTIVRKLNKSDLMKIEVPWPTDRSSLLRLVSEKRAALSALAAELEALHQVKASVLTEVFGGN